MLGRQRRMNGKTMKKTVKNRRDTDELRPEYDFSSSETRPISLRSPNEIASGCCDLGTRRSGRI